MKNNFISATMVVIMFSCIYGLLAFTQKSSKANDTKYEYRQFSSVEGIGALARSKILSVDASGTTVQKDLQIIFGPLGIQFGNIANNDRLIVEKINEYTKDGWELFQVTSGVYRDENTNIGLTRYLFRKAQ